jgi:hypothetical protein
MKLLSRIVISGCCAIAAGCATTPSDVPKNFPPDAQPVGAEALKERLSGRSFTARQANGFGWEIRYAADGRFSMWTNNGNSDRGRWRTEDSRVCLAFEGSFPSGCSVMRASPSRLYLKRGSTGEVMALEAKP